MPKNKFKILIVEDESMLADLYAAKFKSRGFDVEQANDGLEAEEKILRSDADLILLDIVLPQKDGFELLRWLRQDLKKETPVIILSNLGQDYEVKQGLKLGADGYLVKANFTPGQIVDYVEKFLKEKTSR